MSAWWVPEATIVASGSPTDRPVPLRRSSATNGIMTPVSARPVWVRIGSVTARGGLSSARPWRLVRSTGTRAGSQPWRRRPSSMRRRVVSFSGLVRAPIGVVGIAQSIAAAAGATYGSASLLQAGQR
jgi:hypothetical protein